MLANIQSTSRLDWEWSERIHVTRSPDIWFEDGNVVLESEGVQFKVYEGILAANSFFFRDMFEVACPDKISSDGCPLISLHDSPTDLTHFLKALHFVGHCKPTCTRAGFPQLAALLRLGTKYQVHSMRQAALDELLAVYPTSFEKWMERDKYREAAKDDFVERAMLVVLLARETHAISLLPSALYVCSSLPDIDYILSGITTTNGEVIELGWADKYVCIRARERLSRMVRNELFRFASPLADPNPECRTPKVCALEKAKLARGLEKVYTMGGIEASWALRLQCPISWRSYAESGACASCVQWAQVHYYAEQARIWDILPEIFDLPSWEKLRTHDEVGHISQNSQSAA